MIAQQLKTATGDRREALQKRLNDLLGSSNDQLAMLRGAASSMSNDAVQSLGQLAASQESAFQTLADTASAILTNIADYPPQVPNDLNMMMAPLVTQSDLLQSVNVPNWVGIIQSVAPVISTDSQARVDKMSAYETDSQTLLNSDMISLLSNSTANNTDFLAAKLAAFDSFWLQTQNDTEQFWSNYLPTADGEAKQSIEGLSQLADVAKLTATALANEVTVPNLMTAVNSAMTDELVRIVNQNKVIGDINITDYTSSANESKAYLDSLSSSLLENVKSVFARQVAASNAAKARLIQAVNQNAAEDDSFAISRSTAESMTLIQAQSKFDALAPSISSSLASNATGELSASLASSMSSLKTSQADALRDSSADYALQLVRNASTSISAASDGVADEIASFATNTSDLESRAFSGTTQRGLYAANDAMGVAGGAVGAASRTAGGLAGNFTRSVGDLASETLEQAGNAEQTVAISGDALQQLLQAFVSTQAAALATQSESNKAIANQKASIVGILAMWSELIAMSINTSSSGYADITAQNDLLMDGLTAESELVTANITSHITAAKATADGALQTVKDFKQVKSGLIDSLKKSLLETAAAESALTREVNSGGADLNSTISSLNATHFSESSDIQSDLDQWTSDFRQAVSADLIQLAQA